MSDMQVRTIRLKDTPLVTFSVTTSDLGEISGETLSVDLSRRHLMPPELMHDQSFEAVWHWLETRRIPKNRAFVEQVLRQAGLAESDTLGIIDACRGLSLNDSYWVVPARFSGRWAGVNLYDNGFDEVLSLVAYTGYTTSQQHAAGVSSEWTTKGSYPKAWRRMEGHPVLYKAGNWELYEYAANDDLGPHSEYLAQQVAEAMGIPHVTYGLERWKGHLASTCACFCDEDTSFVSMWEATRTAGFLPMAAASLAVSEDVLESLLDVACLDAMCANADRHAGNLGFMRDADTGVFLGTAPVFDNNKALFPTDLPCDYPSWPERARRTYPAGTNMDFETLMGRFMTERQHARLRQLLTFSFEQHPGYPLPRERIEALSALVRENARHYLDQPARGLGDVEGTLRSTEAWRSLDTSAMPILEETLS